MFLSVSYCEFEDFIESLQKNFYDYIASWNLIIETEESEKWKNMSWSLKLVKFWVKYWMLSRIRSRLSNAIGN